MRIALSLAAATLAVAAPAAAQTVTVTPGTSEGVQTDALNGATVTANSALLGGFSVQDAFGAVTSNPPYEESLAGGHVIFADGSGTNFIDFTTTLPALLSGVNIFVSSDGPTSTDRQFATVRLLAGTTSGTLTDFGTATLGTGGSTVRYTFATPSLFQFFRFEGTNLTNGARLLEIDGVAAVPEPASWAMMIAGFGLAGMAMRASRRRRTLAAA